MAMNEEKKPEGEEGPPPEAILETEQQRDPDEAVFAEQAIHQLRAQVPRPVPAEVETALSAFTAWVASQNDAAALRQWRVQRANRRRLSRSR